MKIIYLTIISVLLLTSLAFALPADYKYVRTINTDYKEPVWVPLDLSILDNTLSNGADIRLYSGTKELPFHIEYKTGTAPAIVSSIQASSVQPEYRGTTYLPDHMLDGSTETYYQNDFAVDDKFTTIAITLSEIYKLDSMTINYVESAKNITVFGMINGQKKKIGTGKNTVKLNSVKTNKLFIIFEHSGTIKISKILIQGETFGRLLFEPQDTITYLYYGKAHDAMPDYNTENLYTSTNTPTVYSSAPQINPLYTASDEGGLNDNCPGLNNPDQSDKDQDGVGDACDNCPYTQNKNQNDVDKDGVGDSCDNCRYDSNPDQLDKDLDGIGWVCDDNDFDGVKNQDDNCLNGYNPDQQDIDRDGIGDVCEDDDSDGIPNYKDTCPQVNDLSNVDTDKDKIGDVCDNCPNIYNLDQKDTDKDGIGDVCEDDDSDGIPNSKDNCLTISNPKQVDWDKDGVGDSCDNCPEIKNFNQQDVDRDGIGDVCDKEESRALENPTIVWSIMILAAAGILGAAFFLKKK